MTDSPVAIVVEALRRFESQNVDGIVEMFAEDGAFIDPHYPPPVGPALTGRDAIREGLGWVFGMIKEPQLTVRRRYAGEAPGAAAVEVDTRHVMVDGTVVEFPQVFIGEVDGDGLLRRLQSYLPYPPPSM